MTISYSDNFGKLLLHWRGSLWKSIWKDLLVFLLIFYAINMVYRFVLNEEQQVNFQVLVKYCDKATGLIPITFLLGFFVSMVVTRWWEQCSYVMWPDRFMCFVTAYVPGPQHLLLRRTIARWCNLASALCWRGISVRTLKRFPTVEHLVQSGLMTPEELSTFESTESPYGKWWLPLIWATNLIRQCYDAKIIDSTLLRDLVQELHKYRSGFGMLVMYDWVTVPLVYTQVVAIATYGYFAICLIGRQTIGGPDEPEIYVPVFTILQFLFYIGWLKVGEDLMNPFGEDDDDFELNYVLDRNIQVAYLLAEDLSDQLPKPKIDIYWGQKVPLVPYTRGSLKKPDNIFTGHLTELKFKPKDMDFVDQTSLMGKQATFSWPTIAMMRAAHLLPRKKQRKRSRSASTSDQVCTFAENSATKEEATQSGLLKRNDNTEPLLCVRDFSEA